MICCTRKKRLRGSLSYQAQRGLLGPSPEQITPGWLLLKVAEKEFGEPSEKNTMTLVLDRLDVGMLSSWALASQKASSKLVSPLKFMAFMAFTIAVLSNPLADRVYRDHNSGAICEFYQAYPVRVSD